VLEPLGFRGVARFAAGVRRVAAVLVRGFGAPRAAAGLVSTCSVVSLVAPAALLEAALVDGLALFVADRVVPLELLDRVAVLAALVRGMRAAR
jgi:hypothetical protein